VDIGTPEGEMIFHSTTSKLDFKGYQAVYEVSSKFILYLILASSMDFNFCLCYFYQALTSLMTFFFDVLNNAPTTLFDGLGANCFCHSFFSST
jgi:hypothetical protein